MSDAQLDEFLRRRKDDGLYNAFAYLVRARHYAYHPLLLELRDIEARQHLAAMTRDEALDEALLGEYGYAERVAKWRKLVNKGRNWESTRTVALIDVMRAYLNNHTDDAFIIMDESVFFLDIVPVAIRKSFPIDENNPEGDTTDGGDIPVDGKIPVFRYDGRSTPDDREAILKQFNMTTGPRVLLDSLGTGGQGLNLQSANAPIRCGPWWKVSWEQQAEGRIHRFEQQKPTYVYELFDEASDVVNCLRSLRDKNRINSQILEAIAHEDDRATGETASLIRRGIKASGSSTCALNLLLEVGAWRNGKGILALKAVFVATASRPPRARITRQEVRF
ncbi:unnamed protein product [Fusarium equiseti]|uniref:Helicase C-terminal domain-containing protein n=1 Tax=Fusarium equiseti TaxID=61235 RepID=A0A8J2NBS8_FUSEQ|nr:unnamed protein product [Fusarium equiseti]